MARRLPREGVPAPVPFELDGEPLEGVPGEPLAAALLASGVETFSRSVKYHRPRGPYCLAGRCSHCLMRVDGEPNVYTCKTPLTSGMSVEHQNSFPTGRHDLFHAIDWMYPKGLDHHSLFAGVPVVEAAVSKVARHLAGLGTLPSEAHLPAATVLTHETEVLVIGAGAAGLAAASAAAQGGAQVTLLDDRDAPGGRLTDGLALPGDPAPGYVEARLVELTEAGARLLSGTFAFGAFLDERGRVVAARAAGRRLLLLRHRVLIVATGAGEPLPAFEGNDLPGVFGARALSRLVANHGVLPGERVLIDGAGAEAVALASLLQGAGAQIVALVAPGAEPARSGGPRRIAGSLIAARGKSRVSGVRIRLDGGGEEKLRCDLVAVSAPKAPLFDLARHAGAFVRFDGAGFAVEAHAGGVTRSPELFACGEVAGRVTAITAASQGAEAGRSAAALVRKGG